MQQFRPLPRFELLEEAEPVEMPLAPTTDSIPALTDPQQFVATNPQFIAPHSQFATIRPQPTETNPQFAALREQQKSPVQTSARLPIVLLNGSSPTFDTDRFAALTGKPLATGKHPSLTTALQAAMSAKAGTTGETSRLVVIPGARKGKKVSAASAARRLNPRLRQGVIFLATVIIVICTLTTLVPLSDSQNGGNLFSNIGGWIHSAQQDWDIQAHQGQSTIPTSLNGPGLPYMAIANSPYVAVAEQAAVNAGIPPVYFVRQIQQESGFNPNAVSVTNAQGIAQFEPYTASGLGINPWDPNSALPGAARLMANYYHQYGNYAKALGAYNAGPGGVQSAVYSCGMYWLSCMPAQSRDYVYRIMGI
jgi:transglycosylase-like protein with SLT domain